MSMTMKDVFARTIERKEQQLQIQVVEMLGGILDPSRCWFCHIPNGGFRTKAEGSILQRMGVKPGAPDLLFIPEHPTLPFFIEMKFGNEQLSEVQKDVLGLLHGMAYHVYVCRSIDDVLNVLRAENIPTRIKGGLDAVPRAKPAPKLKDFKDGQRKPSKREHAY